MAHQTDVHTVQQSFSSEDPSARVKDPVCGMELERRSVRHMVFRPDATHYFCSRACKEQFLSPRFGRQKTAA
jgi:YHS domain-containing protein